MKKLCQFIMCLTIGAGLVLGVGRMTFAQNESQAVPAPSIREISITANEVSRIITDITAEMEAAREKMTQLDESMQFIQARIANLGKFAETYHNSVKRMSQHYAKCQEMQPDLEDEKMRQEHSDESIAKSKKTIDQCFKDTADQRVTLLVQNFYTESKEIINNLREQLAEESYEYKRLDARVVRLREDIRVLEKMLELSE